MTRRWVDLKPLEDLEPHFRHRVVTQGRQLSRRLASWAQIRRGSARYKDQSETDRKWSRPN
jgi:hypothetical protein